MIGLLQDYAARAAERDPVKDALVMGDERVTYGELEAESNQLAHLLRDHGCGRGDRICLFVDKSPVAVIAMHAVLKVGAAYVPIDLASPAARIAKILDATEPKLVLATSTAARRIGELTACGELRSAIGLLEPVSGDGPPFAAAFDSNDWRSLSREPLARAAGPDSIAHILFTSGSTGMPKGVVITHANVLAFVEWAIGYFGIGPMDRVSGHPPLHFDLSTFDVYGTFAAGAELQIVPPSLGVDPKRLAALIRGTALTQWFSVPSVLTYIAKFDAVAQDDFPALKRLMWCGEVLPTPVLAYWMARLRDVKFTNLYGPTEATIASSYHTITAYPVDQGRPIPIGLACAGEELLLLDEARYPVQEAHIGEIFISGAGLSPGYWRDPEKTNRAFLTDPRPGPEGRRIYRTGDLGRVREDGLYEFHGRVDSQIKSRGYRIKLGEVEAAINEVASLREAAVVGVASGGFERTAICCAYASVDGHKVEPSYLRRELSKSLPPYMLPLRWRQFDALPTNVNGKIDRRALRESFSRDFQRRRQPSKTATGSWEWERTRPL